MPFPDEEWYMETLDLDDRLVLEEMLANKDDYTSDEWWFGFPEDARDYMEEKIKRKDIDLLDWGKKNVGAFECDKNIPIEYIHKIHRID